MLEALEPRMMLSVGALGTNTIILDNGGSAFETTGVWRDADVGRDGDQLVGGSDGAGTATWTFSDLDPGFQYRLSVTWADGTGTSKDVQYTIIDHEADGRDIELATVDLSQSGSPSDLSDDGTMWEDLDGPHLIRGTSLSVQLSNPSGGGAVADAVRLERVGEWVAPTGVPTPEFGINESHWMYADSSYTYDYGNGPESYRMGEDGPYTHYVDNTASNATDVNNPFGTPDKPRATIPTHVSAGSVVEIHGGSYNTATSNGKIMLAGVGSESKPIFYRGADNDDMPRLNVLTTLGHYDEGRWIIVENLSMASAEVRGLNDHVAIRGCAISNGGGGLRVSGDTSSEWIYDLVIYNNTIHDNGDWQSSSENDVHGITINMYNSDVWIVDNHAYHNGGDSVQVNSRGSWTTSDTYVSRNIFHHDRENAVDLKTLDNCVVSENRMYGYRHTSTSEGAAFVVHYDPNWVWALNNEIYDSEYGMVNTGASDAYFLGNLIYDIHSHGYGDPSSAYEPGIAIHSRNSGELYVAYNTIYDVGSGIAAPNAVVHVTNNIIAGRTESAGYDLNFPDTSISAASQMANNVVYNEGDLRIKWGSTYTSLDAFKASTGKGSGSVEADPRFVAPGVGDFRLTADSPAIDAGTSFDGFANLFKSRYGLDIAVDLAHNPRLYGQAVDIGALELADDTPPGPNEAPTAVGGAYVTDEDKVVTGVVTGDDPDGDAVSFELHEQAAHGVVTMNADGSFTYEPASEWSGSDSFSFVATDGWYDSTPATVTLTVRSVNDVPVVDDAQLTTLRETPLTGAVVGFDVEGDALTYAVDDGPSHGSLSFGSDGGFTYTPDAGWAGTDVFTVVASDGESASVPATISVLVGTPQLAVSTETLTFGPTTGELTFDVTNVGEALLNYTVESSASWLTVAPTTGSSTGEADTLSVQVDRTGLAVGDYVATLTIDGDVAGRQEIQVAMNVPTVAERTWVQVGDAWAYRKGTSAPPADWNTLGFDDVDWLTGPSGIGYSSDVSHPTTLGDMQDGYLTFYARKDFQVDDPNAVVSLDLGMVYDDAFVAYVNGVEVARSETMGAGTVEFDTPAGSMHDEMDPEEVFSIDVEPGLLRAGTNVLAIEVHNVDAGSSDALMAPRLTGQVVDAGDTPRLAVNVDELTFGSDVESLAIELVNTGGGRLEYAIDSNASWLTVAPSSGDSTGEIDTVAVQVDRTGLADGEYVGVLTIDGGGAGTRQVIVTATVGTIAQTEQTWVSVGDTWAYRDGASAAPAGWNDLGFDDSAWAVGASGLGYSSDISYPTTLGDMEDGYLTFYARKSFQVDDPNAVMALDLGLRYDDGFVAYINGVEVARSETMGDGTIEFDTPAVSMHDEMAPEELFSIALDSSLLQAGTNVLAIEVHNVGASSSDALLEPRLVATVTDSTGPVPGDVNADGVVDAADIDRIAEVMRGDAIEPRADLTGDGLVDAADVDRLVHDVLGTEFGDVNLDWKVDVTDFVTFKNNWGQANAVWGDGDFTCDGVIDSSDFMVLKDGFGFVGTPSTLTADSMVDVLNLTPVLNPLT